MANASESLMMMDLTTWIKNLGIGLAKANEAMIQAAPAGQAHEFIMDEAIIDLNVAISVSDATAFELGGGGGIGAFSVNASYSRTYGFKEDAASKIHIKLKSRPRQNSNPNPGGI